MATKTKLNIPCASTANSCISVNYALSRRIAARTTAIRAGVLLATVTLSACGGGDSPSSATTNNAVSLATITTGFTPKTTPPTVLTPSTPSPGPSSIPVGKVITDVRIQNTGSAQTSVPFTFGQVFAAGEMLPSDGLVGKLADGSIVRLQMDVKATHADGTLRHAIISGVLPALAAGQTVKFDLAKSTLSEAGTATPQGALAAGLTSTVTLSINNVKYTASLADALATGTPTKWLSGTVASEWFINAPLRTDAGATHPFLTARFGVRWYSGLTKQARVEVVVENDRTFTAAHQATYDVNVDIAGRSVYAKNNLTHNHHSRWHQYFWWDASRQPAINVQLNTAYLIASKAVPNYDQSVVVPESTLAAMAKSLTADNTGPTKIGTIVPYMGMTGGRGDIGPLPDFSVNYLLTMDKRAKDVMLANADGSGSWSMHLRDENTGYPVRTDNPANRLLTLHPNYNWSGPMPVPRCADEHACDSPYSDDLAHEPSLTFLPYLVTGDYYYLEELHFWAAYNPLGTGPGNHGEGQGLVRWQQVRGQAWSLRTLGQTAYITPDTDPMKAYFTKQVDNNLNFYAQTYVQGNPNNLGIYDGSGAGSAEAVGTAPWQDDFFTWAFGYLTELGFTKAQPILQWKAKFPVGRMTAEGYCWVMGSPYQMPFTRDSKGAVLKSFAELYNANFGGDKIPDDTGDFKAGPNGQKFSALSCGSQAQADFLGYINGGYSWQAGRMNGYSDTVLGYTANMQPALAVAVGSGTPNAAKAWSIFQNRAAKPDYTKDPQWNIIPR
jgi:hypothetical protein